ncbi:MAG: hypothetical protein WCK85_11945 [Chlorobium sp.]
MSAFNPHTIPGSCGSLQPASKKPAVFGGIRERFSNSLNSRMGIVVTVVTAPLISPVL